MVINKYVLRYEDYLNFYKRIGPNKTVKIIEINKRAALLFGTLEYCEVYPAIKHILFFLLGTCR